MVEKRRLITLWVVSCLVVAVATGLGITFAQQGDAAFDQMVEAVKAELMLDRVVIQELDVIAAAGGDTLQVAVGMEEELRTITLNRVSLRSPDFKLLVERTPGILEEEDPSVPRTYRGIVEGSEDSVVAAALDPEGGLNATVIMDGREWTIQPVPSQLKTDARAYHAMYRNVDIRGGDFRCGVEDIVDTERIVPRPDGAPSLLLGSGDKLCELAFDADREFYQQNGSSITNTLNDIENVMIRVNIIWERDVDVNFELTHIIIRTVEPDPYSTTNPGALLGQFQSHWNSQLGSVDRDEAHLMTGHNLDAPTIGIAITGSICNLGSAYGLSESRYTGNLNLRAGLTAHELGHTWGAAHCGGGDCRIMCPTNGGCTGDVTHFGTASINTIVSFRNAVGCLDDLAAPVQPPFIDHFTTTVLDSDRWSYVDTVSASSGAMNEPSPTMAMVLDSFAGEYQDDDARTNFIELQGIPRGFVSYWTQPRNLEAGETLMVDFWNSSNRWVNFATYTSDGTTQDWFQFNYHELGIFQFHDRFRIRFRNDADNVLDDWYVDDLMVTEYDIDVFLVPDSTTVQSGNTLTFDASVTNLTASFIPDGEAWIDVFRPDNSPFFLSGNPKFGPKSFTLNGSQTKQKLNIPINVAGSIPVGSGYRCVAYVGDFTANEIHKATDFFFEITP